MKSDLAIANAWVLRSRALDPVAPRGLIWRLPALRTAAGEGADVSDEAGGVRAGPAGPGEGEAFGAALADLAPDVRRLCRRLLGEAAPAEDAAAEALTRAQERRASYDAELPLRPWLLSIAAHHCIDLLRRRSAERRLFDARDAAAGELADRGPSPLQQLLRAEERARLLAAIDALPPKYRLPLVLRHFAELDYAAIAELLGVTRNQVGTLLIRARRRLRRALGGGR